jgi:hypothetical protein
VRRLEIGTGQQGDNLWIPILDDRDESLPSPIGKLGDFGDVEPNGVLATVDGERFNNAGWDRSGRICVIDEVVPGDLSSAGASDC